jgi:hypothetical protein
MKDKKKKYARWHTFFLLAGLSSFVISNYRIMETYENHFKALIISIFLLLGFGIGTFSLFYKKKEPLWLFSLVLILLCSSSLILFFTPFLFYEDNISFVLELCSYFLTICLGISSVFLLSYSSQLIEMKSKEKDNYWVYIGLILGAFCTILFDIFLSAFIVGILPICFFFIAGLCLSRQLGRSIFSIISVFIIILVIFFSLQILSYRGYLEKEGDGIQLFKPFEGLFSTQLNLGKKEIATKQMLTLGSGYEGVFPTYRPIYVNGHHYGDIIEALPNSQYPDYTLYKIGYSFLNPSQILILNGRGSNSVYLAQRLTSASIDVIEKNQFLLQEIRDMESSYIGGIYHKRNTLFYRSSGRSFIASSHKTYDMIVIPYTIYVDRISSVMAQEESLFSLEALNGYLKVLHSTGSVNLIIESSSQEILDAFTLNMVATLRKLYSDNETQFLDHVKIFSSSHMISILFKKEKFLTDFDESLTEQLNNLGFSNNLDIASEETSLNKHIKAIINNNSNDLEDLKTSLSIIKDSHPYWLYDLKSQLSSTSLLSLRGVTSILIVFSIILIVCILFIAFCMKSLKQTLSQKIQLPGVVTYFCAQGFALGTLMICFLETFYFLLQGELSPGILLLSEFIIVSVIGSLLFKGLKKRVLRIILSNILTLILLFIYIVSSFIFFNHNLLQYSLLLRIVIISLIFGILFVPLLTPFIAASEWLEYFDNYSGSISYTVYYFSLVVGTVFSTMISIYFSLFFLLIVSFIALLISLVYFILMHLHYKKVNFLYRRSGY